MEENTLTKREKRQLAKEEKRKELQKASMTKQIRNWSLGLLIVGVLAFGGYRTWKWVSTPVETVDTKETLQITEGDWLKGNPEAQVTIVEYADYQCPACASYNPLLSRLTEEYSEVAVVYRHYPLVTIHPNAFNAAKASEAAGKQGKFWEMHDILYEKQTEWSEERNARGKFFEYAEGLELDMEKFESDFDSNEVKGRVEKNLFEAQALGLNSTPSFFVNGERFTGGSFEDFASRIDELTGN
jgi:protein-disulfide isomerase